MNKLTRISSVAILLILLTITLNAQGGGAGVPFLRISPDARSSGMGEIGTAIADDINAIYWNPAGLGFLDYFPKTDMSTDSKPVPYRQIALCFSPWLPQFNADLFYSYGTAGMHFDEIDGTVAFNFIFMNLGEFTRTDINGNPKGNFTSSEYTFGLAYGTVVAKDLALGFQLRYIRSNLAPVGGAQTAPGTGNSGGFDIGALWKPKKLELLGKDIGDIFSLGINLKNIGPKITYIKEADPLPTTLRMAAAFNLVQDEFNDLKIGCDVSKLLVHRDSLTIDPLPLSLISGWKNPGVELALGAEYWYEHIVALRLGYFTEPAPLGDRKYWNFGAGVRYDIFHLDFSFINTIEANHPLANTMRFSVLIDLE
ncbi:MAG: PorV/PorQ family protein [Candidatus Kapabacteria bacterium]|nr:PorV/PorQ family protein [Candidatus Kapabacteria bacterium]